LGYGDFFIIATEVKLSIVSSCINWVVAQINWGFESFEPVTNIIEIYFASSLEYRIWTCITKSQW